MNDNKQTLPLFHFLFCQLIQQCYTNHKQDNYIDALKRIGRDVGFKLYNLICTRLSINQRPNTIQALVKNIQTKIFKFLFKYQAANVYSAQSEQGNSPKQYYYVVEDNVSIYLTWMPNSLLSTSAFFAGIIQIICQCSGFDCTVNSFSKLQTGDNPFTEYQIKYSEAELQKWKQNQ